jgi:phosphoribosyl-dephospho-CoA transferase
MKQAAQLKQVNIKMPICNYERLKDFSTATGRTIQSVLIASSDEYLQRQDQLMAIEKESMLSWQEYLTNDVEDSAELQSVIDSVRSRARTALENTNPAT